MSSASKPAVALQPRHPGRWSHIAIPCAVGVFCVALLLVAAGILLARRLQPILRARLLHTFQQRFNSPVTLDDVQVHYDGGLQVDGRGLTVQSVLNGVAGDAAHPMLRVQEFHFHLGLLAAVSRSPRIHHVRIRGVQLELPSAPATKRSGPDPTPGVDLEYAEVDDAHIRFATSRPDAAPFVFDLPHLAFRGVSRSRPIRFHAVVDNGPPIGISTSDGTIGPWDFDDPRLTPLQGSFAFHDKDMSSVRGLRGKLNLSGKYDGTVGAMHAVATATHSGFALDVSSHPADLVMSFDATMLAAQSTIRVQRLQGTFGHTTFVGSGEAVKDRTAQSFGWTMDTDAPHARLEDVLAFASPMAPPMLQGNLQFQTRLRMRAGPERVLRKLSFDKGTVAVTDATISNARLQQMLNGLAERAQGDPHAAAPGRAEAVSARIAGTASLRNAVLHLPHVAVTLPGSQSALHGDYFLESSRYDLSGTVATEAKLSHMTGGVKHFLLKPFDHLLGHSQPNGSGATLPLHISGIGNDARVQVRVAGMKVDAPGTQ